MTPKQIENTLALAYLMNPASYLSYEQIMDESDEERPIVDLTAYGPLDPEQLLIKKERWASLREETRQTIQMIVDSPVEMIAEILGTRKRGKRITPKQLYKYLSRSWGDEAAAGAVISEIRQFLNQGGLA